MFLKRLFISGLLIVNSPLFAQEADWTFFAYMEASDSLAHEAFKNISDMALGNVPANINIFVQLHTKGEITWLYKIEGNNIILQDIITISGDAKNNILQSMKKIIEQFPAKHYGMILWNHGFGILVPTYDPATNTWNVEPDGDNCFGTCDLINVNAEPFLEKKSSKLHYKGLLINDQTKTVMNNEDMIKMFKTISSDFLRGKKLDLCGMDCCLGAMIEHGYQLKDYVTFLVGTQDCELSDGWDYAMLIQHLREGDLDPQQVARNIVIDYGNYCEPIAPVGKYTQSAMDLSLVDRLVENLETIVTQLYNCIKKDPAFKDLVKASREECIRFCQMPAYTDIYHFYENLLLSTKTYAERTMELSLLKKTLEKGQEIIEKMVIANKTGKANKHAQGVSIYFPLYHIDSSYPRCLFAQETSWLGFLQKITSNLF